MTPGHSPAQAVQVYKFSMQSEGEIRQKTLRKYKFNLFSPLRAHRGPKSQPP